MKTGILRMTALAAALAAVPLSGALADRAPDGVETSMISEALLASGFTSWGHVRWDDDGYWEIDDAVDMEGQEHDLRLDEALYVIDSD